MKERVQKNNRLSMYRYFIVGLVNSYLSVVLILGIVYLVKSRTRNIGTISAYMMGDNSIETQAFFYTAALELAFIICAISGSLLLLTLFNLKYKKIIRIFIPIQLSTMLFYIFSRVTLITGVLHIATNGVVGSLDLSNLQFILSQYLRSKSFVTITIILLVGAILTSLIISKYNKHFLNKLSR